MFDSGAPLYDALAGHVAQRRASFHTPGHKGRAGLLSGLRLLEHDLTELPDTGSLYDGGDAIERAERRAAPAFGAEQTLFSAGGCSLCIQAMLTLAAGGGRPSRMLFARNAHRSAVHAAALLDIDPVWIWPSEDGQVSAEAVDEKLTKEKNIRAVYITSPDYYGRLADVAAIASVCRRYGVPLLVDNAHGSHLGAFGLHPLSLGASMTADSSHKTLPVLTGGAMLHIGRAGEEAVVSREEAKAAMALFGSTSPSFPVLASLDLARDWWERAGREAYAMSAEAVGTLVRAAEEEKLTALGGALRDPARLTLDTAASGADGLRAAAYFRECGCEPEYADARAVVFIVTPFNTPEELDRLRAAIRGLPAALRRGRFLGKKAPAAFGGPVEPPEIVMSPRDALLAESETVAAAQAAGRIAARTVCPCPPGVPAVVPGERVDEAMAQRLSACGFDRLVVLKSL